MLCMSVESITMIYDNNIDLSLELNEPVIFISKLYVALIHYSALSHNCLTIMSHII